MQLNFETCHIILSFLDPSMAIRLVVSCRLWANIVQMTLPCVRVVLKALVDEWGDIQEMLNFQLLNEYWMYEIDPASYLLDIIKDLARMLLSGCKYH